MLTRVVTGTTVHKAIPSLLLALLGVVIGACGISNSNGISGAAVACGGLQMAVIPISLIVEGEEATGLLYEPYRVTPGDLEPRDLIVFAHGSTDTAASFPDILGPLALRTATPLITMDHRSASSRWKPGEWNVWAGWQDTVAATLWYQQRHPSIQRKILWGWSQGGTTSGLALVHGPRGLYDYWVDSFGAVNNFAAWIAAVATNNAGFKAEIERDAGGCTPTECPDAYVARSVDMNADRIDVKRAFLLYGAGDTTVPIEQSVEIRTALIVNQVPVSSYTLTSARDENGQFIVAGHGRGPVADEAVRVIERILVGSEPMDSPASEYLIDEASGINTAPQSETIGSACSSK